MQNNEEAKPLNYYNSSLWQLFVLGTRVLSKKANHMHVTQPYTYLIKKFIILKDLYLLYVKVTKINWLSVGDKSYFIL